MPTYAILGATGSTGSSLVRYLHERPDKVRINLYARSASKLESLHPYIKGTENVKTFVGVLSRADLLKDCLRDVDVIFSTVAQNINEPGCSIAQLTAHSIVSALETLRKEAGSSFRCPILVLLSSSSLNPRLSYDLPWIATWLVHRANYYIYKDLVIAMDYLKEQSWIPLISAEPPALVKDISRGHKLSEDEPAPPLLSYDDLARGMVQMAEEDGGHKWVGKRVGVGATGEVKNNIGPLIKYEITGLIAYFFPAVWRFCNGRLWSFD